MSTNSSFSPLSYYFSSKSLSKNILLCIGGNSDDFLGKCILEKILRLCVDERIRKRGTEKDTNTAEGKIFVLILCGAQKHGKEQSKSQRFKHEIMTSPLFDSVKGKLQSTEAFEALIEQRVHIMEASIVAPGTTVDFDTMQLQMRSEEDARLLREQIHLVIHCASHHSRLMLDDAASNKDAKNAAADYSSMARSFLYNILGSLQLLNTCKTFTKLESFCYVSSCFVNCDKKSGAFVREELCTLRLPRNQTLESFVEEVVDHHNNGTTKKATKKNVTLPFKSSAQILKALHFPNSYTLSKRITELLINKYRGDIPVAIVRPSIIGSSEREPIRGWIDPQHVSAQSFGSASIYLLVGMGMIRVIPGNSEALSDQIPVDFVVNATLLAAAAMATKKRHLEVFQIGSSVSNNPCTWAEAIRGVLSYWQAHPPRTPNGGSSSISPEFHMVSNKNWYYASLFMSKPGWMGKSYEYIAKKISKPLGKMSGGSIDSAAVGTLIHEMQTQADQISRRNQLTSNSGAQLSMAFVNDASFHYFTLNEWSFDTKHTMETYERLRSPLEREIFNLDVDSIDWDTYFQHFCYGLHRFCLKEDNVEPPVFSNLLVRENEYSLIPLSAAAGSFVPRSMVNDLSFAVYANSVFNSSKNKMQFMQSVLQSPVVQREIRKEMDSTSCSHAQVEKRAQSIMEIMFADPQMKYVRTFSYLLRKVWRLMYSAIFIDTDEISMIRKVASKAGTENGPLILLPTHRSYIDFLIISFVCFAYDLPIPHIAAGEDFLGMLGVRTIFRHSGAFFLRRSFQDDGLYKAIFQEYVQQLLSDGAPLEFFVEGTRSRGGKTMQPKLGLLSIICDTYLTKRVSNLTIVPINISYEKVLERESYSYELLGEKKTPETLANLLKNVYSVLSKSYGSISVSFSKPIQMNRYVEEMSMRYAKRGNLSVVGGGEGEKDAAVKAIAPPAEEKKAGDSAASAPKQSSTTTVTTTTSPDRKRKFSPATNANHKKLLVQQLANNIAYSLDEVSVTMPTSMLATIVLQYRNGISRDHLMQSMLWLRREILQRQGRVHWSNSEITSSVVDRALSLMKNEINHKKHMIEPAIRQSMGNMDYKKLIQLHCYKNQLVHMFVREAIVACAFGACQSGPVGKDGAPIGAHSDVPREQLLKESQFLGNLMSIEFIHNPDDPEVHFSAVIDKMVARGILRQEKQNMYVQDEEAFQFLQYILWPFIDTYWITVQCILTLNFPGGASDKRTNSTGSESEDSAAGNTLHPADRGILHERIQWLAEKCFFNGQVLFYESCTLDTIKNAVSVLLELGILERVGKNHVQLKHPFDSFSKLTKFSDHILRFRKIGKQKKMVMPLAKL